MDKNKQQQQHTQILSTLSEYMTKAPKEFRNIMDQVATEYYTKFNKDLILKRKDIPLIDGSDAQHYFDSLTLIEEWIEKCIDEIKIYLKPICYPLFVHLYLQLLDTQNKKAHRFLELNRQKFKAFDDEIEQLSKCQNLLNR